MQLKRATVKDAVRIWKLQKNAFSELLAKYADYDISPGNESLKSVTVKLLQPFTYFYYILENGNIVGAIRVVDRKDGSAKRIAPIFILSPYRNRGLAQQAILEAEKITIAHAYERDFRGSISASALLKSSSIRKD